MAITIYENEAWGGASVRATLNKKTGIVSLQHAKTGYNYRTKIKVSIADFKRVAEQLDIWNPYRRHPETLNQIAVELTGKHIY